MHLGHHYHRATPITKGIRYNMVIFCRSHKWREKNKNQLYVDTETPMPDACPFWCWDGKEPDQVESCHRLKDSEMV